MSLRLLVYGMLLGLLAVLLYAEWQAASMPGRETTAGQAASAPINDPSMASTHAPTSAPVAAPTPVATNSLPRSTPEPRSASPVSTPSSSVPALSTPPASLPDELGKYVNGLDGTYGVAVKNLADGQTLTVDAERVFPAGSLYKLLVMYRVYQSIERGESSLDDPVVFEAGDLAESENGDGLRPGDSLTIAEAVDWMITFSSNPAAYALARQTGGWNEVQAAASELGMIGTTWDGSGFVTTPADMLRFFDLLGRRALVSPKASEEMTAVLLQQTINDRIPAGLPLGTSVAHKTAELPEVRNDAGIVFGARGSFAIVIMSEGIDPPKASLAQAEISRMVYERLGT